MHEAFNLGLDPSLTKYASHATDASQAEAELEHSENQWPDENDWNEALKFVSVPAGYGLALRC